MIVPGSKPRTLLRGESAVVTPGTLIDLGDGNVLELLSPERLTADEPELAGGDRVSHIGKDRAGHRIAIPGGGSVVLSWAARSDVGHRRQSNEDSVVVASPMFAVADGMGGHAAGDRASAAAVEHLSPRKGVRFLDLATLEANLAAAADDIDTLAEGIPVGVGTTVTGAALVLDRGRPDLRGVQHRRQPRLPLRGQRAGAGDDRPLRRAGAGRRRRARGRGRRGAPRQQRDHARARFPRRSATGCGDGPA